MSWLWKNDHSSPASYEKALSKLSTQITSSTLSLDASRTRARRIKALWTLYTTVGYILCTLILALVLGPQKWAAPHYAGLVGAPVVIYGIRRIVTLVFDWRIGRQQSHVNALQKQRETKIAELKAATKYDTTQELLRKYGESPPSSQVKRPDQGTKRKGNPTPQTIQRTGIPPPPTANIPGRNPSVASPQQNSTSGPQGPSSPLSRSQHISSAATVSPDEPGFAPNAFSVASAPPSSYQHHPHWYDRVLDVLLGEDETLAKNRLALICSDCRLVNGQAPPGVRTLEEVGRWKCSSCHSWNGKATPGSPVLGSESPVHQSPVSMEMTERPRSGTVLSQDSHAEQDMEEVEPPEDGKNGHLDAHDDDEDDQETKELYSSHESSGVTKRTTRSSGIAPTGALE